MVGVGRKILVPYLCLCLFLVLLCSGLVSRWAGIAAAALVVAAAVLASYCALSTGLGNPVYTLRYVVLMLLAASVISFQFACIEHSSKRNLCFETNRVVSIRGRVIFDSSVSSGGNLVLRLSLTECQDAEGNSGSASGNAVAVGKRIGTLTAGEVVRLTGSFSEDLFIYSDIQVVRRSRFNDLREHLVRILELRIMGYRTRGTVSEDDKAANLSTMLLLGKSSDSSFPLKEKALSCGCSHIFALSGMHLGILAGICFTLFGRNRFSRALSITIVVIFVFIAGPRPSLVRSAIAFLLFFISAENRTVLCLFLQLLVFPHTVQDLGFSYGYIAVLSIEFVQPLVSAFASQVYEDFGKFFWTSVCVLLLSIPLQMTDSGFWNPAVIVLSPVLGLMVSASMVTGLLILACGRLSFLIEVNNLVYKAIEWVLDLGLKVPQAHWTGYAILLALVLLPVLVNAIRRYLMGKHAGIWNGALDLSDSIPGL